MDIAAWLVNGALITTLLIDGWLFWFLHRNTTRNLSYIFLQLHIVGVLLWTLSVLVLLHTGTTTMTAFTFVSALLLAMSKYYFALTFPNNTWPRQWWHYIHLPVSIVMIVLAFIPGALFQNVIIFEHYYVSLENGVYAGLYSLLVAYFLLYPIFHLIYKRKRSTVPTSH